MANEVPEVYVKLRDMLHHQGMGFTPTEDGNEFAILQRFFTEEEAANVLTMPRNAYFTPADWAKAASIDEREARNLLEDYSKRGLIFRLHRDGCAPQYRVQPMLEGIWEEGHRRGQHRLDHERSAALRDGMGRRVLRLDTLHAHDSRQHELRRQL
jgi:hypothetical protein